MNFILPLNNIFKLIKAKKQLLHDGVIMLCKISNVLQDESLSSDETVAEKLSRIAPVRTTAKTYLGYDGRDMGAWGEPMKNV